MRRHGTLGILTEATIKLAPRPEAEATLVVPELDESKAVEAMTRGSARHSASAARPGSPRAWGGSFPAPLCASKASPSSVDDRAGRLAALIGEFGHADKLAGEDSFALWRSVRDAEFVAEPRDRAVWRVSLPPSRAAPFAASLEETALAHFLDWGGGLVWVATDASATAAGAIRRAAKAAKGHATLMRAPDALRAAVEVFEPPSALGLRLSRGLKQSFDPDGVLNFGRMYDGV